MAGEIFISNASLDGFCRTGTASTTVTKAR
jgi:hypothetical protein